MQRIWVTGCHPIEGGDWCWVGPEGNPGNHGAPNHGGSRQACTVTQQSRGSLVQACPAPAHLPLTHRPPGCHAGGPIVRATKAGDVVVGYTSFGDVNCYVPFSYYVRIYDHRLQVG